MSTLVIVIHVFVCIALIFVVLLQTGKGADMGAAFGGGSSQTLFGSTGASSFLSKMTTGAAIVFMLTSLTLAYVSNRRPTSSLMRVADQPPVVQETEQAFPDTETTAPAMTDPGAASEPISAVPATGAPAPAESAGESAPPYESTDEG